ncbi:hypothetical protein [Schleiferia thermophila]|jgi:septal ring factor EnvC (AmiA/AmiB activator)|uniref:Uncharacterized protein n=1 Tax=Schleiferia thermophila TaxID=884107 RepID=A0A369ABH9_9FLAO|nr:hypothetical protein [Schleiferia thermophila]KFD40362.1 hypothetical protein AT05_02175 [Schleiferia thermophila str. Yellowstone]RCX05656.1 hypothetical protein DES35_101944 [Schleiferia thermophila]GCD78854.1 hypothetical protein JCM30197_01010 [Schleiferia thermophila]
MDSKKIELVTLITVAVAILAAIYFGFIASSSLTSASITNWIFAIAFAIYIVYQYIRTLDYEKIKNQLLEEIKALNQKVEQLNTILEEKSVQIDELKKSVNQKEQKISQLEKSNKQLTQKISDLEAHIEELKQQSNNPAI